MLAHNDEATEMGCVILPLLGKFRGDISLNRHLIPIAGLTATGIDNRYWMNEFMSIKQEERETKGWTFDNSDERKSKQVDFS